MFFWVQNGLMTPRLPAVYKASVPRIIGSGAGSPLVPFDPEGEPPLETKAHHLFASPREAYSEEQTLQEHSPLLFASQVMSSPVLTLHEGDAIKEAESHFLKKRFRHIPIVNSKNQIVGIISDRDIWKSISEGIGPSQSLISEIMVKKVLTGSLQTEIRYAAKVMLDEKVGALPIVEPTGELLGMVTRTDLIRAIVKFPGFTLFA
jgi:acetoin utilization protein AcuB